MFEKIIAIKNVNQSEAIVVLTLLFLTYVPTKIIIKYDNELIPKGKPITTSFINPAKNLYKKIIKENMILDPCETEKIKWLYQNQIVKSSQLNDNCLNLQFRPQ